jgi:putative molybdopterin biosynthesis protein
MSIYLHDIPLSEAQAHFAKALAAAGLGGILGVEGIDLNEGALGRVLAEPVWAKISSPHYHASAMDGFAVRSEETVEAMPANPVVLNLDSQAAYLDTGDPLPNWANAVIPIENVEALDSKGEISGDPHRPQSIRIRAAVVPWSHVRPMGEDIVATQLVLPSGHVLRPVDLGAVAACGHSKVKVSRQPRVAVLPTGSELVPVGQPVRAGDIIEYNSLVLSAQITSWGGVARRYPIVRDVFEEIHQHVIDAAQENDLILLNAGSSAGTEDFSQKVVEALGELLVHGVAVRPGHPVILGMVYKEGHAAAGKPPSVPIIGVPGYPVSAALTAEIFVEPLISRWLGRKPVEPLTIKGTLTRKITSPAGDDDFLRVVVGRVGERTLVAPLSRGAGVITSLVRADGLLILPRGTQGLPAGAEVQVRLYRPPAEIEKSIFAIGSHDICLDVLAQFLFAHDRRLTSANVGSLGGLIALRRGEAHLAGSHLLDPQTGEFNLRFIREYLPGQKVKVVALVGRQQGLMVRTGNPKGIQSLADLVRPEVFYINRQRGAGTRVLLDYHLGLMGISPEDVKGYNSEEYTHLAVAAAISSGRADCGLGIAAAAQALDLVFIPLFDERYDLVIPEEYGTGHLLAPIFEILEKPEFRQVIANLPGYDTRPMGNVIAELG